MPPPTPPLTTSRPRSRPPTSQILSQDAAGAFDRLVGLVRRTSDDERTSVRTRLIELFELFDPADPEVIAGRRNLANALYWPAFSGSSHSADVGGNASTADAGRPCHGRRWHRRPRGCRSRAVVDGGVGVEHLTPPPGAGQAEAVTAVFGTGEVEHARHHRAVAAVAQEAQHVVGGVIGVDPGISLGLDVLAPQRRTTCGRSR